MIQNVYRLSPDRACAFIGTGQFNCTNADFSVVAGGFTNTACGVNSFIGSGDTNTIYPGGSCSVIAGGNNNKTDHPFSFIGGGNLHDISAINGTIVGGVHNTVSGAVSFVGG